MLSTRWLYILALLGCALAYYAYQRHSFNPFNLNLDADSATFSAEHIYLQQTDEQGKLSSKLSAKSMSFFEKTASAKVVDIQADWYDKGVLIAQFSANEAQLAADRSATDPSTSTKPNNDQPKISLNQINLVGNVHITAYDSHGQSVELNSHNIAANTLNKSIATHTPLTLKQGSNQLSASSLTGNMALGEYTLTNVKAIYQAP